MTYPSPLVAGVRAPEQSKYISLNGYQLQALPALPATGQLYEIVRGPDGLLYNWNGAAWVNIGSGGGGGGVGGQIQNMPASTQIVDSLNSVLYRTVHWALEFRKAPDILIFEIIGTHNGIAASDLRPASMLVGTGLPDISATVTLSGGFLQLQVTPVTTGWTVTWSRIYAMQA